MWQLGIPAKYSKWNSGYLGWHSLQTNNRSEISCQVFLLVVDKIKHVSKQQLLRFLTVALSMKIFWNLNLLMGLMQDLCERH